MASQKQIEANRQNAQKSTGPQTPEGKAAVSQNALKHGLTAQQAVISGEDKEEFEATRQSFEDELKPVGPLQTFLVEKIVTAAWRLARLRTLESGLELQRLQSAPEKKLPNKPNPPRNPSTNRTLHYPPTITKSPNRQITQSRNPHSPHRRSPGGPRPTGGD